jgi:subtilisin family serine protease
MHRAHRAQRSHRTTRRVAIIAAIALLASLLGAGVAAAGGPTRLQLATPDAPELDTGRILLRFEANATAAERAGLHASLGAQVVRTFDALDLTVVSVPNPAVTERLAAAYDANPLVAFAEVDAIVPLADGPSVPNDTYYWLQWEHEAIDSPEAWATATGSAATLITICDTGVSATHPDLVANLRGDLGVNTASGGTDWSPVHYHGTAVAGSAAAAGNNGVGVSGVSQAAGIVPVRVSDRSDGAASLSALADCIRYAADIGSIAANVSYTTYSNGGVSPTILAAADYANALGTVVVIAAGNSDRDDAPGDDPTSILYVAATNSANGKASFSNYGASVDVAAPGESVVSTYSEVTCRGRNCTVGIEDYAWVSGTSFSSPIVAGAVALAAGAHSSEVGALSGAARADYLRGLITGGACDLGAPGEDDLFGAGLLNVHAAVHGTACQDPIPAPSIDAILVSPILATLYVDATEQFTATALWTDGSATDVTSEADWSSSDPSIATIDAAGLATGVAPGNATITATIDVDGSPLSGSTPLTVSEAPPVGTIASVASIDYSLSGGKNQDRNLAIRVAVADDLGNPVEGAQLDIWLQNADTGQLWIGNGTTATDGAITFNLRRAPSGTYTTLVMTLAADGLTWDGNTPPNSFTRP